MQETNRSYQFFELRTFSADFNLKILYLASPCQGEAKYKIFSMQSLGWNVKRTKSATCLSYLTFSKSFCILFSVLTSTKYLADCNQSCNTTYESGTIIPFKLRPNLLSFQFQFGLLLRFAKSTIHQTFAVFKVLTKKYFKFLQTTLRLLSAEQPNQLY